MVNFYYKHLNFKVQIFDENLKIILSSKFIKIFLFKSKILKCNTWFLISLSTFIKKKKCLQEITITILWVFEVHSIDILFSFLKIVLVDCTSANVLEQNGLFCDSSCETLLTFSKTLNIDKTNN